MKIGIIGGGFTGLAAGYALQKNNHQITIIEKDKYPGGLAIGFKDKAWNWSMEKHYHHFFTNDDSILALAKEIKHKVIIKRPKTSIFLNNEIFQLDSPVKALRFPKLSLPDRIRMGIALGVLRYNPFWKPLEKIKTSDYLPPAMGEKAYKMIWEPQLIGKFGNYSNDISLAWFWARIKKRTTKLAYPEGGFLEFAENLSRKIEGNGGKILLNTEVTEIESNKSVAVKFRKIGDLKSACRQTRFEIENYDAVIVTLPSFIFLKIAINLSEEYKTKLNKLKSLGAINLVLRLKEKFFKDNTYWLSVCDTTSPIMAIVEHTNFMDKKNYNNENLVYAGKYLPFDHPYFSKTKEELLAIYDPFFKKINKDYKKSLIDYCLFKSSFAQPIIPVNYSKIIPPFETPLKNVYLANIQQVYPWDRGTNYAVELGKKVAKMICAD